MRYIIIMLLFISCSTEYIVDSRLKPYVDTFYNEGAKRGKSFKKDNLVMTLKRVEGFTLGQTAIDINFFGRGQVYVYIDIDYFNMDIPYYCKESVIFHELGHALLDRDHKDQVPSIMNSQNKYHCYKWDYYNNVGRDVMIDELFLSR